MKTRAESTRYEETSLHADVLEFWRALAAEHPNALTVGSFGTSPGGRDLPWVVARYKEMNAMLAREAAAHDATYVDVYTPSIGHDACQLPTQAWLNAAVLVPPSFPAHPNQLGEIETSRVVTAAVRRFLAASGWQRG